MRTNYNSWAASSHLAVLSMIWLGGQGMGFGNAAKGLIPGKDAGRIVGGTEVPAGDLSFAAYLFIAQDSDSGAQCTGSLITENVVMTAAHCLVGSNGRKTVDPKDISVGVGSVNDIFSGNRNVYGADRVEIFPDFKKNIIYNDIGLIFLSKNVSSSIAQPIKIFGNVITQDLQLQAAGWGQTSNEGDRTSTLMQVPLHVGDPKTCRVIYPLWQGNDGPTVCTGNVDGQDTCYGDSGGPMFANQNGENLVVGITSFGDTKSHPSSPPCGADGGTAYYTHAYYYINWISQMTRLSPDTLAVGSSVTNQLSYDEITAFFGSVATGAGIPTDISAVLSNLGNEDGVSSIPVTNALSQAPSSATVGLNPSLTALFSLLAVALYARLF